MRIGKRLGYQPMDRPANWGHETHRDGYEGKLPDTRVLRERIRREASVQWARENTGIVPPWLRDPDQPRILPTGE